MFGVTVLLEHLWPLMQTQLSGTGPYIDFQNFLVVFRFSDALHTVKASTARSSKTSPKHLRTSTMFVCGRCCVLFFVGLIPFSVQKITFFKSNRLALKLSWMSCISNSATLWWFSHQSPWARCHDPSGWTAFADEWWTRSIPDASYSQPNCSWDDLLGISTLCASWSGNQELLGGEWSSGQNRRFWHV